MILKSLTILLILKTAFGNDEEAYVEISDERDYSQDRSGRLLHSIPQHPLMDIMLQTANNKYVPKVPGDFFDFLRDSYPLPGGLKAPYQEYDYVIVGAGSAGCVLASRLSENRNVTVLLLEVGKPEMIFTDMPALSAYFQSTEYSWPYYMEHQPGVCNGMLNKRCYWPRGRAVGGTSVINYMIYTRGRPEDWDRIAAAGNYGWSYNEVLEYYKKSEKAAGLGGYEKLPYRNRDGELPVEFVPYRTKLIKAFLEAGKLLGHPTVDYNAPDQLGFGYVQVTSSRGRRYSAAKSFLHDHKRRRNLHILPESTATKILIDETNTAYGIAYVRNKIKYTVKARREVILSAGPIASPQLLMLSGIGPKERLQSLGIPVIKDLPVGQTLYDHICFPGAIFELNTTGVSFNESKVLNLPSIVTWIQNGDNPISTPGGVEGIGYIKTPVSDDPAPVPDVELISIGGSILSDGGVGGSKAARKGMRISNTVFEEAFGELDRSDKDTWSAFPMLLHPKSVGRLELKDSNPFSHPLMYGNYLSDPRDVAAFIASIRYVQALAATEPFQKYGAKIYRAQYPDCKVFFFDSDEYWECALRTITATLHHQTATCRMGPKGDPLAIVDPELRVYGINRLRVGDSSVFPRTISAHTNAPAMMVGEKLSDLLKLTWNSVPYQHG